LQGKGVRNVVVVVVVAAAAVVVFGLIVRMRV